MKKLPTLLPFVAGWILLLATQSFQTVGWVNGGLQLLLFLLVVCLPTWRTGRMSWVDIGWPWGLVVIGGTTFLLSDGNLVRIAMVCGLYGLVGGRMGIFALELWRRGVFVREFPRYRYQEHRWTRAGIEDFAVARQTGPNRRSSTRRRSVRTMPSTSARPTVSSQGPGGLRKALRIRQRRASARDARTEPLMLALE